jgi:NAD dependent epimerase/dehydratase family enzyme
VAPNPVRMKEFAKILGRVLNRPAMFRVPELVLKIIFGESADIILKGQKVIPEKILSASFQFKFTQLKEALENLLMKL